MKYFFLTIFIFIVNIINASIFSLYDWESYFIAVGVGIVGAELFLNNGNQNKTPNHNPNNLHSLAIHISPAEALACSECQKETKGMQIK